MDRIETTEELSGEHTRQGEPASVEQLRRQAEAVFDALDETAARVEAAAQAKAEAIVEARTREASEGLEEAKRKADELRARAGERLQAVERLETALREPCELLQARLAELTEEFRRLTSFIRSLLEIGREDILRSIARERVQERDLAESLHAFTHQPADESQPEPRVSPGLGG